MTKLLLNFILEADVASFKQIADSVLILNVCTLRYDMWDMYKDCTQGEGVKSTTPVHTVKIKMSFNTHKESVHGQ